MAVGAVETARGVPRTENQAREGRRVEIGGGRRVPNLVRLCLVALVRPYRKNRKDRIKDKNGLNRIRRITRETEACILTS